MTSTLRLEVTIDYAVRAKRGERKGPRGCLRKTTIYNALTIKEAIKIAREHAARIEASDGYMALVSSIAYDERVFEAELKSSRMTDTFSPTPHTVFKAAA